MNRSRATLVRLSAVVLAGGLRAAMPIMSTTTIATTMVVVRTRVGD